MYRESSHQKRHVRAEAARVCKRKRGEDPEEHQRTEIGVEGEVRGTGTAGRKEDVDDGRCGRGAAASATPLTRPRIRSRVDGRSGPCPPSPIFEIECSLLSVLLPSLHASGRSLLSVLRHLGHHDCHDSSPAWLHTRRSTPHPASRPSAS